MADRPEVNLRTPRPRKRPYQPGAWRADREQQLNRWNPLETPVAWMCEELRQALDAIQEPHSRKKRITVLRLAEASARGQTVTSVFDQDDTCAQQAWYGKTKGSDKAWQNHPDIAEALKIAKRRAHWWYDMEETRRAEQRHRMLEETKDELVDMTRRALCVLGELMEHSESDRVKLDAAESVLNRADQVTALKTVDEHDLTVRRGDAPVTMADIRKRLRKRTAVYHEVVDGEDGSVIEAEDEREAIPPPPPVAITDLQIVPMSVEPRESNGNNNNRSAGNAPEPEDVAEPNAERDRSRTD